MSKESINKRKKQTFLEYFSELSDICCTCVRYRSKKCRNKDNTYFFELFYEFSTCVIQVSYEC